MNIHPVHGTSSGERGQRFFCDFYEQWSGLIGRSNWYDFTLIKVQGEFAPYTGRWELELGILGLKITLTYIYDRTFNDRMVERVNRIKAERGLD